MEILDRIRQIGLPDKEFIVMGSAILEVKGIRKANDLDIMIKKDLFETLKKDTSWRYTHKIGSLGDTIDLLDKDGVQLYFDVYGRASFDFFFADPAFHIELVEGIYFTSLLSLLEVKSNWWNREKDKEDANLIREYLTIHSS